MASLRPRVCPEPRNLGAKICLSKDLHPILVLVQGHSWNRPLCVHSSVAAFPTPHLSLANRVICYIWTPALSHQGQWHQLKHLQTAWETCDRMGSTSRISLILEPPLPIRDPHWLAGTTSRSVTGGLLVAGLLLMELMMS